MGESLTYESLLCKAHNCDRGGANGAADADVYRKLENAQRMLEVQEQAIEKKEIPPSNRSINDLKHEFRAQTAKVRNNILQGLREINRKTHDEKKKEKLLKLMRVLNPDEYSKEMIDDVIDQAWDIVRDKDRYYVTLFDRSDKKMQGWFATVSKTFRPEGAANTLAQGESVLYPNKEAAWQSIQKRVEELDYDNDEVIFNAKPVDSYDSVLSMVKKL
ncbi:MAG: hypothetical protein AAGG59_05940 [Bacteroidota bacterium]